MKNSLKYLSILAFGLLLACENPNPLIGLPPITTEGKGTFGYRVNGEVQGQCYDGLFTDLADAEMVGDTTLNIYESCNSYALGIYIQNDVYVKNKIYDLSSNESLLRFTGNDGSWYFSNRSDMSNASLTILEYDTKRRIIAGTFFGTLQNEEGESVEITDGRFDLIYREF